MVWTSHIQTFPLADMKQLLKACSLDHTYNQKMFVERPTTSKMLMKEAWKEKEPNCGFKVQFLVTLYNVTIPDFLLFNPLSPLDFVRCCRLYNLKQVSNCWDRRVPSAPVSCIQLIMTNIHLSPRPLHWLLLIVYLLHNSQDNEGACGPIKQDKKFSMCD